MSEINRGKLRSQAWWDNPSNPDMTALYLERFLNYGLTRNELQSGRPIIGIAQTGSDLVPCNRHHLALAVHVALIGHDNVMLTHSADQGQLTIVLRWTRLSEIRVSHRGRFI